MGGFGQFPAGGGGEGQESAERFVKTEENSAA